ncbi:hypothetical protein BH11ACT2_BH11ACT2_14930 [soil metagenome]
MRFVFAIVAFVIAAVLIGGGIAQRTIFLPPDQITASVAITSKAPVTVIEGPTLTAFPNHQHIQLSGADKAFAAYGRTDDVLGWVGASSYNLVSYDKKTKQLASKLIEGTENVVPNPAGSDLWLAEYPQPLGRGPYSSVPNTISFIIVSDGTAPAPSGVSLSWPVDNSTPWVVPLLIAGIGFLLLGLILLLWAIAHVRRARGPRRRSPKMPKLPKQPRYKPSKRPTAVTTGSRGRRSSRTSLIAAPLALAGIVALSGCTSITIAPNADTADPKGTTNTSNAEAALPPAVTVLQADRIIARIAAVAASADKKLDASTLADRFAGPALALRTANYKIRKVDKTEPAVATIQTHVRLVLPQQNDKWPRTVFAVVDKQDDEKVAPIALMLVQDDARSQYKVHYAANLEPGTVIPQVAGPKIGTQRLDPDGTFFAVAPSGLAAAYGDILSKDAKSASYPLFDPNNDSLRTEVGLAAQKAAQKKLPKTAKLTFSNAPGTEPVIVLATLDQGAIVATELEETQTVKPVQTGATVNAPKSIKALSGKAVSTKGITATYGDQLIFFVPPQASTTGTPGLIQLLGYGQGLISAAEVKK